MSDFGNVVLIGASDDPERYAHRALKLLLEKGYTVIPVHPKLQTTQGVKVYPAIQDVPGPVDTVTLYVSQAVSSKLADAILQKKPRRIIFNPGAENQLLMRKASEAGIKSIEACTLVLLSTGQFNDKS